MEKYISAGVSHSRRAGLSLIIAAFFLLTAGLSAKVFNTQYPAYGIYQMDTLASVELVKKEIAKLPYSKKKYGHIALNLVQNMRYNLVLHKTGKLTAQIGLPDPYKGGIVKKQKVEGSWDQVGDKVLLRVPLQSGQPAPTPGKKPKGNFSKTMCEFTGQALKCQDKKLSIVFKKKGKWAVQAAQGK